MVLNPSTQVQALPPTIPELAEAYCAGNFTFPFHEFVSKNVSESEILVLQETTTAQSKSQIWLKHRIGALTSTTMHSAANYTRDQTDNYIVREILGQSKFQGNAATRYGTDSEPIARKLYAQGMKKTHKNLKVKKSGIFVNRGNPLFRSTPDGIVTCKCCGTGLLEIKCPYSNAIRLLTGTEIATNSNYHITIGSNGKVELKRSSPWYTQIQTHLGVSGYKWCDFVLFTEKSPHLTVERIFFDESLYENVTKKAMSFYEKYVLPKLFSS